MFFSSSIICKNTQASLISTTIVKIVLIPTLIIAGELIIFSIKFNSTIRAKINIV